MWKKAILIVIILLCALEYGMAAPEQDITIISRVALSEAEIDAIESLDLIGISTESLPNMLKLVWRKDNNSWGFPLWRLELQGSVEILAGDMSGLRIENTPGEQRTALLAMLTPQAGKVYEIALSYAANNGNLSLSILDVEEQTSVYISEFRLMPQQAQSTLSAEQPANRAVSLISTEACFVPVGIAWALSPSNQTNTTNPVLSTTTPAQLHIESVGVGIADAKYRLVADAGSQERVLWTGFHPGISNTVVVPTAELPTGSAVVRLEYILGEKIWQLGEKRHIDIYTGAISANVRSIGYMADSVVGRFEVATDTPLNDLEVSLTARITQNINGIWKQYGQQPLVWSARVDMDEAGVTSLPFSLNAPALAGSDVRVEFSLNIETMEGWSINTQDSSHEFTKLSEPWKSPIPVVDISAERSRQTIIDHIPGQYLGHPDTVLMGDGHTILVVYPLGHGGPSVLRRSDDGGKTWSERQPVPASWAQTANVPTIFRLTDREGVERLVVFNNMARPNEAELPGRGSNDLHQSVSADGGKTWTEFKWNGIWTQVAPNTVIPISGNRYLTVFQMDGRIEQSISNDGGLSWEPQKIIARHPKARLTEPALIASPDGKQLAVLIRENTRKYGSMLIVSNDEGKTWSQPVELPDVLTGDRHMPKYTSDGRLVITFRDRCLGSPTYADFVAWVGTYDDLVNLRNGAYRVRLLQNKRQEWDTGYAGLEVLPDGVMISTTYVPLIANERPSVVSVRYSMAELDAKVKP